METLNHIECELQKLSIALHPPAPTEPLGEVIRHYTNTLCSAKKTNQPGILLATRYTYILMDMIPHT